MKKFVKLTYDGPIFFGINRHQERGSIFCKHRRTEEKATRPLQCDAMPWQSKAIEK